MLLDRGFPIPSPAVFGRIGREYVVAVENFIVAHEIPVVRFQKGDVKEDIAREHFQTAERDGSFGVVMVGIAQARPRRGGGGARAARTATRTLSTGGSRSSRTTTTGCIRDPDWGRAFLEEHRVRAVLGVAVSERE